MESFLSTQMNASQKTPSGIVRKIGSFLRPFVGEIDYHPPAWLGALGRGVAGWCGRHPKAAIGGALGLVLLGVAGWQTWAWWEAHRPRPREFNVQRVVEAKVAAPGDTVVVDGKEHIQPVRLVFSASAAPVEAVGKAAVGVGMKPAIDGSWKWADDKTLRFDPKNDWPAGTEFTIRIAKESLPPEVKTKDEKWVFSSRPLEVKATRIEFYTNPADPDQHQVTATLASNHPLDRAALERQIDLQVVGTSDLFAWQGAKPAKRVEVTEGKDRREFFVRSARITVPAVEDNVRLTVRPGLPSLNGGKPLAAEVTAKVRVPDRFSGFAISGNRTEIVRTEPGEPEQVLFLETSGYVEGDELGKHCGLWFVPQAWLEQHNHELPATGAVDDALLAQWRPVKATRVESEKAEGAPVATAHAFKFLHPEEGTLFLRVTKGVQALGGFELARDHAAYVGVPAFPKEVAVLGKGGVMALGGERKLGLKTRRVDRLRLSFARVPLGQVNHLAALTEGDFQSPYFTNSYAFNEENLGHFQRHIETVAVPNAYEASYPVVDLAPAMAAADPVDPDASRGFFFVRAEGVELIPGTAGRMEGDGTMEDWRPVGEAAQEQRFLLVTDLGLLVKRSSSGVRDVFVQSLATGQPVEGARIVVVAKNGEFVAEAQTSDGGHAALPDLEHLQREKQPAAIVARLGNDVAFLPFNRPDRMLDFSRFDVGGLEMSDNERLDAFLFTERGVYRPGDPVHVAAVVRRRDWQGRLEGLPVELKVWDARGHEVFARGASLPADGLVEFTCPTEEAFPTGIYRATLFLKPEPDHAIEMGRVLFRVEDFQPDRMKMELVFDGVKDAGWIAPEKVTARATLATLFGFAAADRRVKARLELSPALFAFERYPDHTFHNRLAEETESLAGQEVDLGEKKTDEKGQAVFDLALERFKGGCFRLDLLVEGFEADGGRGVRATRPALVSPFPYVVGYKPDGDLGYVGMDAVRKLHLLAINPNLDPVAVEGLAWRVVEIRFVSVLTKQENGNYAYVSTRREHTAAEGPLGLPAGGEDFTLPTQAAGQFRFELRDTANNVVCTVPYAVVGKGEASRSLERNAELELKLARPEWNSGEEIELSVRAPYAGAGVITIEREKVVAWQWFQATTTASVQRIRVPEGIDGTWYVNVGFVRSLASPEVFMSPLSYAVQPFTANPAKRRLSVTVDAPQVVRPGAEMRIGYQASMPCRLALFAVDAGIHQVTDYKLPEPLKFLQRKRALEVGTEQLLDMILPEFSLLRNQKAFGGDGSAPKMHLNPFKRRRDAPVVLWSGLIAAGPDRREITYAVPDYFAGKLNIMAVAVAAEHIGQAETASTVRGPMVLTPNVPLFVSPGDEFTASLTVANNLEGKDAAGGITLSVVPSEHLAVTESPREPLVVGFGQEKTARFKLKANDVLGGAELAFRATGGGETMERRATLSVRPAAPFLTHVQSGYFRLGHQEVKVKRDLYPQFRRLEATASGLPLGLAVGLESFLHEYPWGCSEQITSRAMGRLLLADEADFGFDKAESVKQIESAFQLLRSRQHANGGFGYWDSASDPHAASDFLSVYVTHFLTEAREGGYAVPAGLIDGARARLKQIARAETRQLADAANQAAAIYLLARNGEVSTNELLNLRDTLQENFKDAWQGDLAAAYMAGTYVLLKKDKEGEDLMKAYRKAEPRFKGGKDWWNSYWLDPAMRRALGFALVCRHFPGTARGFGYDELKPILEPIEVGRLNTISSSCTILALKAYSKLVQEAGVRTAILALPKGAGEPQILAPMGGGLQRASFEAGIPGLRLERDAGASGLGAFYQVVEAGFDRGVPTDPVRDGIEVVRELVLPDGKPANPVRVGDPVQVRIVVRNLGARDLPDLAVLDLMPGGFEVEPNALKPGRRTVPGAEFVEVREDRNVFFLPLGAGRTAVFAYRIKPVAAGAFAIPPVFAESMYDPGIKGRSGGGRLTVVPAE